MYGLLHGAFLLEPVVQFSVTPQRALKTEKPGGVAQLGEHLPCKQGVMGSIPIISTIFLPRALGPEAKIY